MHLQPVRAACAFALMMLVAVPSAPQGAEGSARAAVVAQKQRLVEQLLASPRAKSVDAGADAPAQQALTAARELLAGLASAADGAEAERRLDEALRLASQAMRSHGPPAPDVQRQRNAELRAQTEDYRRQIVAALKERKAEARSPLLVAVDQHLADADDLARAGRPADAGAALERANRAAQQGLARLRDGEEVTITLKFDTPADEYAYELKRFRSYDELVDAVLADRGGAMRHAVEQQRQQAYALRDRAAGSAARGDHQAGIGQLEDATRALKRALQAAGVSGLY